MPTVYIQSDFSAQPRSRASVRVSTSPVNAGPRVVRYGVPVGTSRGS